MSIFHISLAIFALGLLIFIHELGHYWAARKVGMKVEVFSIGFGKSLFSWKRKGVVWKICWFPFGGFVKIKGQDRQGKENIRKIRGGFYSKSPLARMFVAVMGPFMNALVAFLLFSAIWMLGGREETFSRYSKKVGWINPQSELYAKGVRIGDEITSYNGIPYEKFEDHYVSGWFTQGKIAVKGYHVTYSEMEQKKVPFLYEVRPYKQKMGIEELKTSGIVEPARFFIANASLSPFKKGDRLIWVDGEYLFSNTQLDYLINHPHALLTIEREGKHSLVRIPLLPLTDIMLNSEEREELIDQRFALNLFQEDQYLLYLPYKINSNLIVERQYELIEDEQNRSIFTQNPHNKRRCITTTLQNNDRILSVNGTPIDQLSELLRELQEKKMHVILQKNEQWASPSWEKGDLFFDQQLYQNELSTLISNIGKSEKKTTQTEHFSLLSPIVPQMRHTVYSLEEQEIITKQRNQYLKNIVDIQERQNAIEAFEQLDQQLVLGFPEYYDLPVRYNPLPHHLFMNLLSKMKEFLFALVHGSLPLKALSGAVGITHITYYYVQQGAVHLLFWVGVISVNLAIFNLLPIPPLDGGIILFSGLEALFRKSIPIKWFERITICITFFFIALFIFVTYHDIYRLLHVLIS